MLDTNVVVDFLSGRNPFYEASRLLMIVGRVGEFELWISSSQVTDLIYILSNGGNRNLVPEVLEKLRGLRTFVNVYSVGDADIDKMLYSMWSDPEDALISNAALSLKADCLVTRNQKDYRDSLVRVMDCNELFDWLKEERGIDYKEIAI